MRTERVWNLWPFRRGQSLHEVRVEAHAEVNDPDALLALATSGAGITVLPAFLAQAALQRGQLMRVLPEYALPDGRAFVMHAARRSLPRAARDLLDCFRAAVGQRSARATASKA